MSTSSSSAAERDFKKELLRKFILLTIGLTILEVGIEYLPIFSNYELLEEQLHQGYLHHLVNLEVQFAIYLLLIVIHFAGLFLLYQSKPVGRLIYLISFLMIYRLNKKWRMIRI